MCVTNIAKRRNVAVANASAMVSNTPSLISQRLVGNFMPLMMNNTGVAKPLPSTNSTCNNGEPSRVSAQSGSISSSYFREQSFSRVVRSPDTVEKRWPKRRRKPQKPGKTAKQNDRHFVVHNYHDHSMDPDENDDFEDDDDTRRRGGIATSFPTKLHTILEQLERDGWSHVISWQPHGRCFLIHKPKEFTDHVMPHYFRQSKLTSFQRQLNLYGFCRLTRGKDAGGYYHELFLRGRLHLTKKMQRTKIKGTKFKGASSPEQEPDFYKMPFVSPANTVSDDSSAGGSAVSGRASPPLGDIHGNDYLFQTSPYAVSPSSVSTDPLVVQMPQTPVVPALEPYPLMNAGGGAVMKPAATNQGVPTNSSTKQQFPFSLASLNSMSQADDVLDQAVDELFDDANDVDLEYSGNVDKLWDATQFGEDSRQEDIHLGYMLDKLLGN